MSEEKKIQTEELNETVEESTNTANETETAAEEAVEKTDAEKLEIGRASCRERV